MSLLGYFERLLIDLGVGTVFQLDSVTSVSGDLFNSSLMKRLCRTGPIDAVV